MCCTRAWLVPSWSPAWGASADIMPDVISAWELDLGVWRPGTAQQQPLSGVHAWTQLHLPSRWHRLNVCTPPSCQLALLAWLPDKLDDSLYASMGSVTRT